MALRRLTLLFIILTIVLGVIYQISRSSFPVQKFSDVQILWLLMIVISTAPNVRKKIYVVTDPEISDEHSGSLELPGETVHDGRSLGSEVYDNHEGTPWTGWTSTSSSTCSRCQLLEYTVSISSSFHQSQCPLSAGKREGLPLSEGFLLLQLLLGARNARNGHSALPHSLSRPILLCLCMALLLRIVLLAQNVLRTLQMKPSISDHHCFLHDLRKITNGPAENPEKDHVHSLISKCGHFCHTELTLLKQLHGYALPADTCRYQAGHRSTDYTAYIPKRPVTYTVFPASFLPSVGSSPQNSMSFLGSRLASLNSLPASCNVFRVRLAQTGFYYDTSITQRGPSNIHEVTCYSCGLSYGQWKDGDNPELIHRQLRPGCPHLQDSGNTTNHSLVSMNMIASMETINTSRRNTLSASSEYWSGNSDTLDSSSSLNSNISTSGLVGRSRPQDAWNGEPSVPPIHSALYRRATSGLSESTDEAMSASSRPARDAEVTVPSTSHSSFLGSGATMNNPVYPQFYRVRDRQASFVEWPHSHFLHPDHLVMQGFYYAVGGWWAPGGLVQAGFIRSQREAAARRARRLFTGPCSVATSWTTSLWVLVTTPLQDLTRDQNLGNQANQESPSTVAQPVTDNPVHRLQRGTVRKSSH